MDVDSGRAFSSQCVKKGYDNEWHWINATNLMNEVAQSEDGATVTRNLYAKDSPSEFKNWPYQTRKHSMLYMPGLKRAEEWVFEKLAEDGQMNTSKVFENSEEQGPVLVMVDLLHKGGFLPYGYAGGFNRIVAVYLYDFTAVPILPSDTGNNYVTEIITDTESAPKTVASNARNMTGLSTSASQTVSTSHSVNVTSNINGSRNYSFSVSVKTGISYDFLKTLKGGIDITISSSQAAAAPAKAAVKRIHPGVQKTSCFMCIRPKSQAVPSH